MQLILETNGLKLSTRKGRFLVQGKAGQRYISPAMISSIAIHANILVTSAALEFAIEKGIPVYLFDGIGNPTGRIWSSRFASHPIIRRNQVLFEQDTGRALPWVVGLYLLKTNGQLANLQAFRADTLREEEAIAQFVANLKALGPSGQDDLEAVIMGIEGSAAKAYWKALAAIGHENFAFQGRSRRPASDHFNCLLNYGYGMLYNVVEGAVFSAGLDAHLGIVHTDNYNRPSLVFDLIEPFRPWVDRLVVDLCLGQQLQPKHFEPLDGGGWSLNRAGKQVFIPAYLSRFQEKTDWQGKTFSRKNHIYQYAGKFAAMLKSLEY